MILLPTYCTCRICITTLHSLEFPQHRILSFEISNLTSQKLNLILLPKCNWCVQVGIQIIDIPKCNILNSHRHVYQQIIHPILPQRLFVDSSIIPRGLLVSNWSLLFFFFLFFFLVTHKSSQNSLSDSFELVQRIW